MDFLVQVSGEQAKEANPKSSEYGNMVPVRRWVLEVDEASNQFLVTNSKGDMHWVKIDQCKFMGTPIGQPQPVYVMNPGQPQQKPDLAIVRGAGLPRHNGQ